MITGCSSKKETSIENCADENYVYDNSDSMTRIYYDINDKKIQGHSKGLEESIKKKENYSRQFTKWIKKNYNGTPEPKNIIYPEELKTESERETYKNKIQNESKKFVEMTLWHASNVTYMSKNLKELKNYSASKRFWKAPLKKKIIDELYYNQYVACEKEYSEAPGAFEMKWKER